MRAAITTMRTIIRRTLNEAYRRNRREMDRPFNRTEVSLYSTIVASPSRFKRDAYDR